MNASRLMELALKGRDPNLLETVEHFANPDHWGTMVVGEGSNKRAVWVWLGPNKPPFELAQRVAKVSS